MGFLALRSASKDELQKLKNDFALLALTTDLNN